MAAFGGGGGGGGGPRVVLDIAPSRAVRGPFRDLLGDAYVSAGLQDRAWVVEDLFMDITDIQQPDRSYDVILCSHVLEHVEDDAKALSELRRVLRDDGLAIVDVPPWGEGCEETYEDPAITTPAGRAQAFGQHDHVRRYGKDFLARLRAAGLHAQVVRACDVYSDQDARRHGFQGERFFLCAKSAAHPAFAGDAVSSMSLEFAARRSGTAPSLGCCRP